MLRYHVGTTSHNGTKPYTNCKATTLNFKRLSVKIHQRRALNCFQNGHYLAPGFLLYRSHGHCLHVEGLGGRAQCVGVQRLLQAGQRHLTTMLLIYDQMLRLFSHNWRADVILSITGNKEQMHRPKFSNEEKLDTNLSMDFYLQTVAHLTCLLFLRQKYMIKARRNPNRSIKLGFPNQILYTHLYAHKN